MESRRISIDVSEETKSKWDSVIPWGLGGRIMRLLVCQVVELVESHGDIILGALLTGKITALDLLKRGGKSGLIEPAGGNREDE